MPKCKGNFWGKIYCDDYDYEIKTRQELNIMKSQFIKEKKTFIYGKDCYGITSIKLYNLSLTNSTIKTGRQKFKHKFLNDTGYKPVEA